jgi:hypothetical protein
MDIKVIFRVIPYILILCIGCRTASRTARMSAMSEDNMDVVLLSYRIRDYMRKSRNTHFTLSDIVKNDTLGQVTRNFSRLEVAHWPNVWRGGYVVYFKFSAERNKDSVKLLQGEKISGKVKTKKKIGRNDAQIDKEFDGEIRFYYPERHYRIVGITVKEPATKPRRK